MKKICRIVDFCLRGETKLNKEGTQCNSIMGRQTGEEICIAYIKGNEPVCTSKRHSRRLDQEVQTNTCHGTATVPSGNPRALQVLSGTMATITDAALQKLMIQPNSPMAEGPLCGRRYKRTGPEPEMCSSTRIQLAKMTEVGVESQDLS